PLGRRKARSHYHAAPWAPTRRWRTPPRFGARRAGGGTGDNGRHEGLLRDQDRHPRPPAAGPPDRPLDQRRDFPRRVGGGGGSAPGKKNRGVDQEDDLENPP